MILAKLAVLALALCAVGAFAGVARADGPAPTLASDHASYAPGDTVQLTGAGWLPGAPVHVHVADGGGHEWSFDDDVFASADGSMADSVVLPSGFASDFVAVATSGFGGTATTTFSSSGAPSPAPMIVSDQNDYAPGSTVTLTSSGWLPNEAVHLVVDDHDGQTWTYATDLSADPTGAFTHQFQLPNWFVANYGVVATGFSGSSATTAFTDSNPASIAVTPASVSVAPGSTAAYTMTLTVGGNSTPCNVTLNATGLPAGASATFGTNPVATAGSGSSPVTTSLSIATTAATPTGSFLVTVNGTNGSGCQGSGPTSGSATLVVARRVGTVTVGAQTGSLTNGTAGSASYTVTVNRNGATGTAFSADLSVTTALPAGASASFSPSSVSFAAADTSKTSTLTVTTTAATPVGTTPFTVRANNPGATGDSSTGSGTLTVNSACTAPAVTTQPGDQTVTYGSNASFTAAASGTSPAAQWQVSTNGGGSFSNLSGETSATLTLTKPPVSASGNQYRAVFTNGCGSATSTAKTLTVTAKNLTISGAVANDKVYDSTTNATVDFSGASLNGVETGDTVAINSSGYSASFATKTVGTGKPVTVGGVALSGSEAGNYTVSQPSGLTANIGARDLTVSATGQNKVYDGTASASVTLSSDKLAGDTVNLASTGASFATKHVGSAKTVSVSGISISGADAGNYNLTNTSATTSANISQRPISVSAVSDSKVYDGTTSSAATPAISLGSLAAGDSAGFSQAFATKNVGTGKTLIPSGSVSDGNSGNNYNVTFVNTATGAITAKGLTIDDATANDKTYDGNASATVDFTGASLVGAVSGDTVSFDSSGYSASFANKNVGTGKPVTVAGVTLSGGDAGNYSLSQPSGLTADISGKTLSVSFEAQNKTYDGNAGATIKLSPAPSLVGKVSGDDVTLDGSSATASFGNKNVGTGKTVTASGFAKSGSDAGNYVFASPQGTTTADISAKTLSVSFEAQNKTYDGNAGATIKLSPAPSLVGKVSGDDVTLDGSSATASFDNKNVGTGKTVTASGFAKSGSDAGNYVFASPQGTTTADITAKNLTISGAVANDKTYDGNAGATIDWTGASLVGVVGSDDVSIDHSGYSASFANKNVGTGKPVTVSGVTLSGTGAGNYTVSQPSGLTADITAKNLTISGAVANDKTYDGNASATVDFSGASLNGVESGDTVTIDDSGYSASFATKNVGTGKAVTVTGVTLGGSGASNYTVSQPSGLSADITARDLTVSATGIDKVYDGTTAATVTLSTDKLSGDSVSAAYTSAAFLNKHVGSGKTVNVSGISISGADAGNYNLTNTTASTTADITARDLTVSATGIDKVYDGTTAATVTLSTDKLSGDSVSAAYTSAAFLNKHVGSGKTVNVSGISISGADAGNYNLTNTTASTSANISQRLISVSAVTDTKVYDGTTNSSGTPVLSLGSIAAGDSANFSQAFATKNVGTGKTLIPSGSVSDGNSGNNYAVTFVNNTTGVISAKNLTISGAVANNKVYDSTTNATVDFSGASLNGVESGDTVTINSSGYSASFATKNVGTGKAVTVTGVTLGGSGASNYTVSQPSGLSADITARDLTVSATGIDKVYDGTTAATVTLSTDKLSGDSVSAAYTSAAFLNKHVGSGKTVNVSGISISGADAGNYNLTNTTASTSANISQRLISVSAVTDTKVYDGTTNSSGTPVLSLGSIAAGDSANFSQAFATKNVGTGKTLIPSGSVSDGNSGNNYAVTFVNNTTGVISAKNLTISGAVANNKVYDSTTNATVDFSGASLNGVETGDTVTINSSGYSASFATKTVGTGKPVTVGGVALSGSEAGNYTVSQPSGLTANIGARDLTVSATGQNKVYDGNASASVTLSSDKLAGDTVNLASTGASFATKHVGSAKTVSVSGISISGADAGNYNLTNTSATTSANISQRPISVSAVSDSKVYDGTTSSAATPAISLGSLAAGDSAGFSQAFATKNVGTGKTLIPSGSVSDGNSGNNYNVTFVNTATGAISAKNLTVAGITASNKPYDGTTSATINASGAALVGLVSGDAVTLGTSGASGAFTSPAAGTCTVQVSGLTIAGTDSGNYTLTQPVVTACIGAWYAAGFYAPVGVGNSEFVSSPGTPPAVSPVATMWNIAKGGSTIPLKFNLYTSQGGAERTNIADIRSFDAVRLTCATGEGEDAVDFVTTGNTTLRYDGSQFIQNWKTPTASADTCYRVNVRFLDNSAIFAFFKLRK